MEKYYKKAIHLLKYRLNTKHRCEVKWERIFGYDEKFNEAVENFAESNNEKKYTSCVYDIINDVMGDNNELNLDDLEDMDMDLIKCTFDEYFKKSI